MPEILPSAEALLERKRKEQRKNKLLGGYEVT